MKVNGKVFVVTGAGNGMGREVSLELLRRGAKVAGLDLKHEWLEETKNLAGDNSTNFYGFDANITDRARVAALPAEIEKQVAVRVEFPDDLPAIGLLSAQDVAVLQTQVLAV